MHDPRIVPRTGRSEGSTDEPGLTCLQPRRPRSLGIVGTAVLAAVLCGCGPTVASSDLSGFGRAVGLLNRQAEISFQDANRIARVAAVDRFVRSPAVGLSEAAFPSAVPPEVAAEWRTALTNLERYGILLGTLTGDGQRERTTTAFKGLGVELNSGSVGAGISPGVAAGFASLAGTLVDIKAQRDARAILRITDPEVRTLLTAMADAVGDSDAKGLRGTVYVNSLASTGTIQRAYAAASVERNETKQRALANEFLDAADRRRAQLGSLAALRSSLLALADAHTAAAEGSRKPVDELLGVIGDRLDEVERLRGEIGREGARRD